VSTATVAPLDVDPHDFPHIESSARGPADQPSPNMTRQDQQMPQWLGSSLAAPLCLGEWTESTPSSSSAWLRYLTLKARPYTSQKKCRHDSRLRYNRASFDLPVNIHLAKLVEYIQREVQQSLSDYPNYTREYSRLVIQTPVMIRIVDSTVSRQISGITLILDVKTACKVQMVLIPIPR
jgi:hypothetical protein